MSRQLTNHGKSTAPNFALDGPPNLPNPKAGSRHQHRLCEGALCACHQVLPFHGYLTHWNGYSGVRHESIFLDGDIELHQIAVLQRAFAGNPVRRLLVEADATHPRKSVN